MRNAVFVGVAFACLLAGCSSTIRIGDDGYYSTVLAPNPNEPNVKVDEGFSTPRLQVDQEPLYPRSAGDRTHIKWALPAHSQYTFPANGIVISPWAGGPAPVDARCTPGTHVVNCVYRTPSAGTKYKYDINVRTPAGATITLDPFIVN